MKFILLDKRLSFPDLFVPKAQMNDAGQPGKPTYAANFLMEPDDPQVDELNDVIDAVILEHWGDKAKAMGAALRGADRVCLHNGDLKADKYEAYGGMYFVTARNGTKPSILDRDKTPLTQASGRPYGGCFVNAVLDVWVQDGKGEKAKHGRRVNATLMGVQFVCDGDAFAGGPPAKPEDFPDLDVGSEALA